MSDTFKVDNKRIAKNTALLYVRTLMVMAITLYTSRVVLKELGVDNYGIYQVVGGFVAMFAIISSSLTTSISRYITFGLGRGDSVEKLRRVFSTSVGIQIALSLLIILIGETVGVWFLNTKMSIPPDRLYAANWVLQCSLLTFCVNLINVPYNASIIAHERMTAYAYVCVLDAILKLSICFLIIISPVDRLISYAILMLCETILIRLIYGFYCGRNFPECRLVLKVDKGLVKEMSGFAGWSFLTNSVSILNNYGINLLVNIFFGVSVNAARGIANQASGAVSQYVGNFTSAIDPQITKSYAAGQKDEMFTLICRGAKFSYFMLLFFAIPVILEARFILDFWLEEVPDHAVIFVQLIMLTSLSGIWGNTGYTACMATGNIKQYAIWISLVGGLAFPLTWVAYSMGFPAESAYIVYLVVYFGVDVTRLLIMKGLLGFPIMMFVRKTFVPIILTTLLAGILPVTLYFTMDDGALRFFVLGAISVLSVAASVYAMGLTAHEREMIVAKIKGFKIKFK